MTSSPQTCGLLVEPLDASFGAVVRGVDLNQIDDAGSAALHACWLKYSLLVLPGQFLRRDAQIALGRRFGPLELELAEIGNVKRDSSLRQREDTHDDVVGILKGNEGWHADSTYMPVMAQGAVFSAQQVPASGSQTQFADMCAAYDALDAATRARVETLTARHSLYYSQSKIGHKVDKPGAKGDYMGYGFHDKGVPLRPLVKVHPETGRKSLVIGRHAHAVSGLTEAESETLLTELNEFACQPPRVHAHHW